MNPDKSRGQASRSILALQLALGARAMRWQAESGHRGQGPCTGGRCGRGAEGDAEPAAGTAICRGRSSSQR